ncbi:MAG: nucleotidyl transferase AbiEii/AbiGii toxin family protein [Candidatus Omnitrophica bacterium]|nr:nucleotidyl transferase AbiEii/AbiGii toxin family protein [Candidatus Omnitrophota bacterium]
MSSSKIRIHWDVLDKKRQAILPLLGFLKKMDFYLAGGTALALQIRHRRSFDFDFHAQGEFSGQDLLKDLQKTGKRVVLIQNEAGTLIVTLDGIEISFFSYSYKLLRSLVHTRYFNIASLEDIAAMKLVAIIQRGLRRDFIDLYFLVKRLGLPRVFRLTEKKYPPFNKYVGLQAITYFADAEKFSLQRKMAGLADFDWQEVKAYLVGQAREFKKVLEA